MKLRRLDLLRYGHLTDARLEFPEDTLLHVVLGANEAGKSTALAAIGDALFGFAHRSDYGFLHGVSNLRIGFAVQATDGGTASFVRRKGRRDTLFDDAGEPASEAVLQRFLNGATRELFEQAFGLDGERMRKGATELLRAGGEAGESLLAGIGLPNLRKVIEKLGQDAKELFGDGRGRRLMAEAVDRWRKAHGLAEDRAVSPREFEAATKSEAEASAALAEIQQRTSRLTVENSRLHRVRRVAPILAQLDAARARLDALADVRKLPDGSKQRMVALIRSREDGERDLERETREVERLGRELAALPTDADVLAVQHKIDTLFEQRGAIIQADKDLPDRTASAAEKHAKLLAAIEDLGCGLSVEAACKALPASGARRTAQRLIKENAARSSVLKTTLRDRDAARRKCAEAAERLQAATAPASAATLRRGINDTKSEGRIEQELENAERATADAERDVEALLSALPLWHGDLASLTALAVPLEADEAEAARHLAESAATLAEARRRAEQLSQDLSGAEQDMARLARGEPVPTPDAVTDARGRRDRVWRLIRRHYEGGTAPTPEDHANLPTGRVTDDFESLRDQADRLSDRRADEAQRVADYLGAAERSKHLRERLDAASADVGAGEAAAEAARAEWLRLWQPCGLIPRTPEAMPQWRRDRNEIGRRNLIAGDARRRRDELISRRDHARTTLAELVPPTAADEALASLLRRAERQCDAAERAEAEYLRLRDTADREQQGLKEGEQHVAAAEAELRQWHADWLPAMAAIGLPTEASVDAAQAALDAWGRVAELAPTWHSDHVRIAQIEAAIENFGNEVTTLRQTLGVESDDRPVVVVALLSRRLEDARNAGGAADERRQRIDYHGNLRGQAERAVAEADSGLARMRTEAGVGSDAELDQAIERARLKQEVARDVAALERQLIEQGDDRAEADLRAEVAATSIDFAIARIDEIERERQDLGTRREQHSEERTRARDCLAEMRRGRDAAAHAQQAADALVESRTAAERYARLHVARSLLQAGVERFRAEAQDPMLRRAGAHLALLTGGRYLRLIADQNSAGRVVLLAIRDDETECEVEALSDGTRDQLYLALRIAAIEAQAARGELLPFIADDLLVNFDDLRAASAIRLLLELGKTTQVLLFTHHEHIADLAAHERGVDILRLPSPVMPDLARAAE